jgi:phage host-nuclease inhibitor protein Gam
MRKKVQSVVKIKTWAEADQCLFDIGRLDRRLKVAEAELDEKLAALRQAAEEHTQAWQAEKAELEGQLAGFAELHKAEFEKNRTKTLAHGWVNFRRSSEIQIKNKNDTIALLKQRGMSEFIDVKESPSKERLGELEPEELLKVGAKLVEKDTFGYELNSEDWEARR